MSEDAKQKLVDAVIEEMLKNFYDNDLDAIDELLSKVDPTLLQGFLPEENDNG